MSEPPASSGRTSPGARIAILPVIAALAMTGFFLFREARIAGGWGFSLDDAWIHAVIARNVATGQGYAFNAHEPVAGSTAPLYALVLAALYALTHQMIWSAKLLGILCHSAASALLTLWVAALVPSRRAPALLGGLLYALSPHLAWAAVSGMEISLYLLLVCAGLLLLARGRPLAATVAWSAGVWVRPDGVVLALLGCLAGRRGMGRRFLVGGLIVAAFVAFNLGTGRVVVPQSVLLKAHPGGAVLAKTWTVLRDWAALWGVPYRPIDDPPNPLLLLPLMFAGAAVLPRRHWPVAVFPLLFLAAFGFAAGSGGSHGRYLFCTIPFGVGLGCVGLAAAIGRLPARASSRLFAAVAVLLVAAQVGAGARMAEIHAWNVQNVNRMQRWLGEQAGRITSPGDAIAANDIGAIGYFSGRRIVDLVGLIAPPRPFPENLRLQRPRLVIVYTEWFASYLRTDRIAGDVYFADADSAYRYSGVFGVQLLQNTINSRSRMLVFVRRRPGDPPPARRWIYRH